MLYDYIAEKIYMIIFLSLSRNLLTNTFKTDCGSQSFEKALYQASTELLMRYSPNK